MYYEKPFVNLFINNRQRKVIALMCFENALFQPINTTMHFSTMFYTKMTIKSKFQCNVRTSCQISRGGIIAEHINANVK